ncbi:uncharacterized protein LOC115454025 [Manduca sexta]|nr:uncharacterized protein LOC115454025 [Manduca sexta]
MTATTVVVKGFPEYVTYSDVALNLEKIFGARVGPFQIRDLRDNMHISNWQFALDFNSLYEASLAQQLLFSYNFVLSNGEAHVLFAKVAANPKLIKPLMDAVPTARSRSSSYDEDCAILGLVPKVSDKELHRRCSDVDVQIEYINKQRMLLRAQIDFLREKRELWREYKRMNDVDDSRRSRSPRRNYRSRSKHRSRSRSRRSNRSIRSKSRNRGITNNNRTPFTSINKSSRSSFGASNHLTFDMILQQSQHSSTSENSFDKTTSKYQIGININSEINNKINTKKLRPKVLNMSIEKSEAIKHIMKEMDSILDKICYEKNINILEKGVNLNIIRKLKEAVKKRLDNLKITNDMESGAIVSSYRRTFNKTDDKKFIESFLNEYVVANARNENKCVSKHINSSESSFDICDAEDSNMWRAVDEILQDVKIELLSSEDGDERNITSMENKPTKIVKLDEPRVTEVIDLTHEPILVSDHNTQVEMIVVVKNNSKILNVDENKQMIHQKEIPIDVPQNSAVSDIKLINRKPSFFIATKSLMRKMKSQITEIAPTDIKSFTDVIEKDIKNKITTLLKGKEYMKTANIVKLFKEHYPKENYKQFLNCVAEELKLGKD